MYSASESFGGFSSVDSGIKDESLADNASYSDGTVTVEPTSLLFTLPACSSNLVTTYL